MSIKTNNIKVKVSQETVEHISEMKNNFIYYETIIKGFELGFSSGIYLLEGYLVNSSSFLNPVVELINSNLSLPYIFKAAEKFAVSIHDVYKGEYISAIKDAGLTVLYSGIYYYGQADPRIAIAANLVESVYEIYNKVEIYDNIIDHINTTGETSFIMDL